MDGYESRHRVVAHQTKGNWEMCTGYRMVVPPLHHKSEINSVFSVDGWMVGVGFKKKRKILH